MLVETKVTINGSKAAIWSAITDIRNAAGFISGIKKIEILEKPAQGLVGLKWRETRMLFGKPATADKWITHAAENGYYKTRAESDGFIFLSTMSISEGNGSVTLSSSHDSQPQKFGAKLMSIPMGLLFKGVAKKALLQDLLDIKAAVEKDPGKAAIGKTAVLKAEQRLAEAIIRSDVPSLAGLLHDELLFLAPNGDVITKQMDLDSHKRGEMVVSYLDPAVEDVRITGDTATVTVVYDTKGTMMGNPIKGKFRHIRVWKACDGGPKVIGGACIPLPA